MPPDGKFILAEYRYLPTGSSSGSANASLLKDNIPIPFAIKSNVELLDHGGKRFTDVGGQRAC